MSMRTKEENKKDGEIDEITWNNFLSDLKSRVSFLMLAPSICNIQTS
jgi:hypothetical protein